MSSDKDIEQQIQAKGKTAARVTPGDIEKVIVSEHFFTARDGVDGAFARDKSFNEPANYTSLSLLTFCVLVLRNGFTVTGESACASPENFDAELGREIAKRNAMTKIWPLLGYELRTKLSEAPKRKVFTARDIKAWEEIPDAMHWGVTLHAITHCGRKVEVAVGNHDRLHGDRDLVLAILNKLNEEPA
jgi:hypothetical protein